MGKSRAVKPTREQKVMIAGAGKDWKEYRVVMDLPNSLIIKNVHTGENEVIEKPLQVGKPGQRHK